MRIAVLDDDIGIRSFAQQVLEAAGHVCHLFNEGRTLIRTLQHDSFDLLVLDWMMPGINGAQVLEWVRTHIEGSVPILFMTSRGQDNEIASILHAGADDYVVKPVSPPVFIARVEALLRRAKHRDADQTEEQYGPYCFDIRNCSASVNGKTVPLAQKEFELALLLFRNLGKPVSRGYIFDMIWKTAGEIQSRTVDTHVSMVRAKLDLRPQNGYRILSVYGFGYRLEAVSTGLSETSPQNLLSKNSPAQI